MEGLGQVSTTRKRPFGKSTLEVRGRWLRQQLERFDWNAGTLRHHLKESFGIGVTEAAVNNWLRGENDIHVERYLPVLYLIYSATARFEAGPPRLHPYLDWLALAGFRTADLPVASGEGPRLFGEFRCGLERFEAERSTQSGATWAVPDLWIERRQQTEVVHSLLQFADLRQPRFRAVILHGGSGYGKTALARMVGRDPDIARWYVDGVSWLDCGGDTAEPSVEHQLATQWRVAADEPAFRRRLANLSAPDVRSLIILDALESPGHWEWLKENLGPQVQILVTTNHLARTESLLHGIASASAQCAHSIGGFDLKEAGDLVRALTGEFRADDDRHLDRLIDQIGGHPELLYGLAHYRRQLDWETINEIVVSDGLNSFLAELSSVRLRRLQEQLEALPVAAQQRLKQWSTMRTSGPQSVEELARRWHLSARAVREVVGALQAQGVVEKREGGRWRLNASLAELLTPRSRRAERVFEHLDERQREAVRALWKLPNVTTVSLAALASLWELPEPEAQQLAMILQERGWLEAEPNMDRYVIPAESLRLARAQAAAEGRWGQFACRAQSQWLQHYWSSAAGQHEQHQAWARVPSFGRSLLIVWQRVLSRPELWSQLPAALWRSILKKGAADRDDGLESFEDLAEVGLLRDHHRLERWTFALNGLVLGLAVIIYSVWTHAQAGCLAQQPVLNALALVLALLVGELITIGLSAVVIIISTRHFQLNAWLLSRRLGLCSARVRSVD